MDDEENRQDRLSDLPEPLLRHIISFLPTESAVRTRILSRRLASLWDSIPTLEFDDRLFKKSPNRDAQNGSPSTVTDFDFASLVDRRILLHAKDPICRRFRLRCDPLLLQQPDHVKRWIESVLEKRVQELDLDFSHRTSRSPVQLSFDDLDCRSLVFLKMGFCSFDVPRPAKGFRFLRTMILKDIPLRKNNLLHNVLFTCPLLERLSLTCCTSLGYARVFSPTLQLRSFKIVHCDQEGLEIDCSSLSTFEYEGKFLNLKMTDVSGLCEKASLDFSCSKVNDGMVDLFQHVSRVKSLSLSYCILQAVTAYKKTPVTKFANLKEMRVQTYLLEEDELPGLAILLANSPILEQLSIGIQFDKLQTGGCSWFVASRPSYLESQRWVFDCLAFHLKRIAVEGFSGRKKEYQFIEFLLENSKVLECIKVAICINKKLGIEREAVEQELRTIKGRITRHRELNVIVD